MTDEIQKPDMGRRRILQGLAFATAGTAMLGPIFLMPSRKLNLDRQIHQLLDQAGIPRDYEQVEFTCVDPCYAAESIKEAVPEVEGNKVTYDQQHVLHAPSDWEIVDFFYDQGKEKAISHDQVARNLGNGVVQVAYKDHRLVVGVIGDSSSFREDGTGAAFGTRKAPPEVARATAAALFSYARTPSGLLVVAMQHPDCGGYAFGTGVHEHGDVGKLVAADGSNFMDTEYRRFEARDKEQGARELEQIALAQGVRYFKTGIPTYQQRTPSIVGALRAKSSGHMQSH